MKNQLFNTSQRVYELYIVENGEAIKLKLAIEMLFTESENEYIYALQEITDDILDLKKGKSMYFQPNRDDKESKGILLRVN